MHSSRFRRSLGRSVAAALLVAACSDRKIDGPAVSAPPTSRTGQSDGTKAGSRSSLRRFERYDNCNALLDDVKKLALQRVGPYGFGPNGFDYPGRPLPVPGTIAAAATTAAPAATTAKASAPTPASPPAASTAGRVATDSSGTNTQEAGVDEGDVAENDGRYVYAVVQGSRLEIVDTRNGKLTSTTSLEPGNQQMVLDGKKLVVVTGGWGDYPTRQFGGPIATSLPYGNQATTVTIYDVADPAAPKVINRAAIEGAALAVRASGGVVRVVAQSPFGSQLPLVQPVRGDEVAMKKATELNKRVISESVIADWLPRVVVSKGASDGKATTALDCAKVGRPETYAGLGLTWIVSIDSNATTPTIAGSGGVIAEGAQVYASEKNLYVATTRFQDLGNDPDVVPINPEPPKTLVHQFAIDGVKARYLASGDVSGTLLNSYAMSENADVLRVATTEVGANFGSSGQQSSVRVLRRNGESLDVIGSVSGLGRNEQIYAVRFLGEQGYVVTFRRTDPLYVLDLSDPKNPTVTGELKINGYSSYLHPVGDGRLIGIGQDADDNGRVTGMQLSLFDVRDPRAPKRLSNAKLGVYGQSEAEYDPHAFLFWDKTGQVVVPTNGYDPQTGRENTGATVAEIGATGISVQGRVGVGPDDTDAVGDYRPTQVRRSMVVDGKLVLIGEFGLSVNSLETLERQAWVAFGF
jgi:Beta propeller domain